MRRGVAVTLVAGSVVLVVEWIPLPVAADIDECNDPAADWCLAGESDGQPPQDEPGGGRQRRATTEVERCSWVTIPADQVPPVNMIHPTITTNGAHPPPGMEVIWQSWCYDPRTNGGFVGPFRWVPAPEPALPSPEDVASDAYEAIKGRLPHPAVVTSPPAGVEATVDVPVFFTVVNWQAQVVETRDLVGDAVTVTATPELVLNAAEPGSLPVVCGGPGRAYDPAGGDLWAQASAPGACTYTYRQRTGVEGRPGEWPSTVMVRWSISWSATSGESGSFPGVGRLVAIPRAVSEVQAVLVPGGS